MCIHRPAASLSWKSRRPPVDRPGSRCRPRCGWNAADRRAYQSGNPTRNGLLPLFPANGCTSPARIGKVELIRSAPGTAGRLAESGIIRDLEVGPPVETHRRIGIARDRSRLAELRPSHVLAAVLVGRLIGSHQAPAFAEPPIARRPGRKHQKPVVVGPGFFSAAAPHEWLRPSDGPPHPPRRRPAVGVGRWFASVSSYHQGEWPCDGPSPVTHQELHPQIPAGRATGSAALTRPRATQPLVPRGRPKPVEQGPERGDAAGLQRQRRYRVTGSLGRVRPAVGDVPG